MVDHPMAFVRWHTVAFIDERVKTEIHHDHPIRIFIRRISVRVFNYFVVQAQESTASRDYVDP